MKHVRSLVVVVSLLGGSRALAEVRTVGPAGQYPNLQTASDAAY
jgi:hypothetical protein